MPGGCAHWPSFHRTQNLTERPRAARVPQDAAVGVTAEGAVCPGRLGWAGFE